MLKELELIKNYMKDFEKFDEELTKRREKLAGDLLLMKSNSHETKLIEIKFENDDLYRILMTNYFIGCGIDTTTKVKGKIVSIFMCVTPAVKEEIIDFGFEFYKNKIHPIKTVITQYLFDKFDTTFARNR